MNDEQICRRYFVSGRVQGVFYRVSAQQRGIDLQMRGWVRNRRDGRVEVFACGSVHQHTALKNWLEIGPPYAKVSNIDVIDEAFVALPASFEIRSTA